MTTIQSLQTWEVLKELGFMPNAAVRSEIQPGLSFDFGNLMLSAGAVTTGWRLTPVILFTGVMQGPRFLSEVQFEMPRAVENLDICAAWIAWHLDQCSTGEFQPISNAEWLEIGRSNKVLLPWVLDLVAYENRPACSVEREWARMMLKRLKAALGTVADNDLVSFEFDGALLRIRCGDSLIPASARGQAWENRYTLRACQFKELPTRLGGFEVLFSVWNEKFHIANWSYEGVVVDKIQ
ncbi:MAG: hypothetical protein WCO57_00925 [Verrucomicrobiota bacterium]